MIQVFIKTDDMELAGELIQSLAQSLTLEDLPVTAHFPQEMENLSNLLAKVFIFDFLGIFISLNKVFRLSFLK